MPMSISILLEGLVTTLLSLDYLHHQQPELPLTAHPQDNNYPHSPSRRLVSPLQCRSRSRSNSFSSFSSSSSGDSEVESMTYTTSSNNGTSFTSTVEESEAAEATSSSSWLSLRQNRQQPMTLSYEYHCPPSPPLLSTSTTDTTTTTTDEQDDDDDADYYDPNDTVFGQILRGDLPAITLAESERLVALQDIRPRAPLHALIIPKAFVGSIFDVEADDLDWMEEMHDMALQVIQQQYPLAAATSDYRLCFHIPPFHSVNHLHLHVLAPLSQMSWYYKSIKYNPSTRWCTSIEAVLDRLRSSSSSSSGHPHHPHSNSSSTSSAIPYRRPPCCPPQKQRMGPSSRSKSSSSREDENHPKNIPASSFTAAAAAEAPTNNNHEKSNNNINDSNCLVVGQDDNDTGMGNASPICSPMTTTTTTNSTIMMDEK